MVGSANLTSGLVANVEVGAVLRGPRNAPALRTLWELAESWWGHRDAIDWSTERVAAPSEILEADLFARIAAAVVQGQVVRTLGRSPQPNWVSDVTPDGVWVETKASRQKGLPPQQVEAWMIQIAWDWLEAHGRLTAAYLQATGGLNVKRSSFVCALLAQLPDVDVVSARPIELALRASRT